MSPEAHGCLVELDVASREARALYQHAAAVLPPSELRDGCLRMETVKGELVALLALQLRRSHASRVALAKGPGRWRERLAPVLVRAHGRVDPSRPTCRDDMVQIETAILDACRRTARGSGDADCRRLMAWVLPMQQRCRDEWMAGADGG